MAFPKGHNYWQFRNKHGRDFKYEPEMLWNEFIDYAKWLEQNPLYEMKVFAYKGEVVTKEVPKMRAMTIGGFQLFADICDTTWENYCKNDNFIAVTNAIKKAVYSQKFEGAAADLLNANIIARDLGLSDKKEVSGDMSINWNEEKTYDDK